MARLITAKSAAAVAALILIALVALTAPANAASTARLAARGKSTALSATGRGFSPATNDNEEMELSDAGETGNSLVELSTLGKTAIAVTDVPQQWSFASKYNGATGSCC